MERIQLDPSQLADTVQQLLHEGNVRRIIIKQGDHTVVEIPLTVGVVGAAFPPTLAAGGARAGSTRAPRYSRNAASELENQPGFLEPVPRQRGLKGRRLRRPPPQRT